MKRKKLIVKLEQEGCELLRHGSRHDIYLNPANGKKKPVPRPTEIGEYLVRHILKYLGLK